MNTVTYCKHCGRALMWSSLAQRYMHRARRFDAEHQPESAGWAGTRPERMNVPTTNKEQEK